MVWIKALIFLMQKRYKLVCGHLTDQAVLSKSHNAIQSTIHTVHLLHLARCECATGKEIAEYNAAGIYA